MSHLKTDQVFAKETTNLYKDFGNLIAVDGVSFKVEQGAIVGILGPNGAGKTTTIRLITGIFKLDPLSQMKIYSSFLLTNHFSQEVSPSHLLGPSHEQYQFQLPPHR